MKKILLAISSMLALAIMSVPVVGMAQEAPAPTATQNAKTSVCEGVGLTTGTANGCDSGSETTVSQIIRTGIFILSIIVGVAAVIMIIIGGLRYVTSGGDSAAVNSAKNTILYAVIGLVVAALAQLIVQFVLNKVDNAATPPPPAATVRMV